MTAEIYQFRPRSNRSNHNADRAFWIGPDPLEQMAVEIVNQIFPDTAPSELDTTKDRE